MYVAAARQVNRRICPPAAPWGPAVLEAAPQGGGVGCGGRARPRRDRAPAARDDDVQVPGDREPPRGHRMDRGRRGAPEQQHGNRGAGAQRDRDGGRRQAGAARRPACGQARVLQARGQGRRGAPGTQGTTALEGGAARRAELGVQARGVGRVDLVDAAPGARADRELERRQPARRCSGDDDVAWRCSRARRATSVERPSRRSRTVIRRLSSRQPASRNRSSPSPAAAASTTTAAGQAPGRRGRGRRRAARRPRRSAPRSAARPGSGGRRRSATGSPPAPSTGTRPSSSRSASSPGGQRDERAHRPPAPR